MSFDATAWAVRQTTGTCQMKLILICLSDHHNRETGLCCPSIKTLAIEAECSTQTITRNIKKLLDLGYIEILQRFRDDGSQTSNQYRLLLAERDDSQLIDPPYTCDTPTPPTQTIPHEPVIINQEVNLTPISPDGFNEWWAQYPTKVGKKACHAAWKRNHFEEIADTILMDTVQRKVKCSKWMNGYVMNPLTYLNGERWNDDYQQPRIQQHKEGPVERREREATEYRATILARH